MEKEFSFVELKEIKNYIFLDSRLTKIVLSLFVFVILVLKYFFQEVQISWSIFYVLVVWLIICISGEYFVKKTKNLESLYNFYFFFAFVEILILTVLIHFIGGAAWIGPFFYALILLAASMIFPKKEVQVLTISVALVFMALILAEYFGVVSPQPVFGIPLVLYYNRDYIAMTSFTVIVFLLFFGDIASSFAETLKIKTANIKRAETEALIAYKEAEESKKILEIKVKARTKELEELASQLEKEIENRTKELKTRLNELEKFKKIAVGRELKMIELKKEIKNLKSQEK